MPTLKPEITVPDYLAPKAAELVGTPEDARLVYTLDNGSNFVITSDPETLQDVYTTAKVSAPAAPRVRKAAVAVIQAAQPALRTEPAYEDFNTLAPREVLRRKISARIYDVTHKTNMYGLLTEKINEDRDLAMAKKLGLITTDRCAKHEKQLATVRGML